MHTPTHVCLWRRFKQVERSWAKVLILCPSYIHDRAGDQDEDSKDPWGSVPLGACEWTTGRGNTVAIASSAALKRVDALFSTPGVHFP